MLTIVRHGDPLFTPNTCSYPVFVNLLLSKSDWLLTESSWKPRLDIFGLKFGRCVTNWFLTANMYSLSDYVYVV